MKEIEQKDTIEGLPPEQSISILLDNIEREYGHRSSQEREVYALKLKSLMSEDSTTYEEYEKDAGEKAKNLFENLYTGSSLQKARETGLIDSLVAHGSTTLALQIFYDPDKSVPQKRNELAWIRTLTDSPDIELSPVESLAAKLHEAVTPEAKKAEKVLDLLPKQTLEEKLSSSLSSWIKFAREKYETWKSSPIREKLKTPTQFVLGAGAGFVAADYAPELTAYIRNAHIGFALTRGAFETVSWTIASAETKYPRFSELSRKIAAEKSVSNIMKQTGKLATRIQTHPIFLGFTAGILGHSAYEAATGNEQLLFREPEAKIPETAETPEPYVTPQPSPQPSEVASEPLIETPTEPVAPPEPTQPIELEPIEPTPTFETAEYSVQPGDTLSEIVAEFGGDPYGTNMTSTVLQSQDMLLNQTRIGHEAANQLLDYLTMNPEVTWRKAINENLTDPNTGKRIADLFSEALRIIRPGDLFNIVAGP
ncbi:hypothetical protein IID22_05285 [Patescibacteria group bacterium]|nr:hypothetical protein [Patescibacteria group bacterium]